MMEEDFRRNRLLESRMRKRSCPVWREVVGKVSLQQGSGNLLAAYSTFC